MSNYSQNDSTKVNVRILLASLWVCHFLSWSFGDMMSLLQETASPVTETIFLVIAPSLAVIQTLMIVYTLSGNRKFARTLNLIVPVLYLLFNLGYLSEGGAVWNYILGAAYIVFNILTLWTAWKWSSPTALDDDNL